MKRVLFLCTGNYYRSRFAEMLFNHLAETEGLDWRADSCGLDVQGAGVVNAGVLSVWTRKRLGEMGIGLPGEVRGPRQVCEADFRGADLVVAVKEAEHRAMVRERHPEWEERVRYWHVHDLDAATADVALVELEGLVRGLVVELKKDAASTRGGDAR